MRDSLMIFFMLLLGGCKSNEEKTQLQSQYLHYVSSNGTPTYLFQNINSAVQGTSVHDKGTKKGAELISSHLQLVFPPFVITNGSAQCNQDSQTFFKHLNIMKLWAFKMYDSSAKLPSGLLNGNINQFGDFDQCLSIDEPDLGIMGKYCLAYLQIQPKEKSFQTDVFQAFKMIQSHFVFKSKLTDVSKQNVKLRNRKENCKKIKKPVYSSSSKPGHRVPRFSTMNWGLCIPSSCTSQDTEFHLNSIMKKFSDGTGFDLEVKIDPEMCQTKKPFKASFPFIIVSSIFSLILMTTVVATLKDVFVPDENLKKICFSSILNCFSLKRNWKSLVNLSRSSDDISCVHGIRMINAIMLVLSHKSMALFFVPYSNRTSMVEKLSQSWSIIARTASLYTDSFIMMSGLLTSYSFVKRLKKTQNLDLKNEYISRLIRIVPLLATIILLCTFILPELGSGPQWNLTVSHHAEKCKKTWWRNFLFIHNYLGFENMCLTHTHHLGIDTQLFFISPFLVFLILKWPIYGTSTLVGLAAISTLARFQVTADKNLSFFIYPGISVSQMFDTANYSYIIPFHRLTAYIIGILLGYILRHLGKDFRIKSHYLRVGWTITFSFLSYVLTKANEMNHSGYIYDNKEAALYAALAPIAWCLFLSWLIFVSHIGRGGLLSKAMSSKYCLIWTRLSYAVYLTQFPIFFFNVGLQKYPQQYSIFLLVNILEYGSVLISSVVLTLLIDMPFGNMKNIFLQR